MRRVVVAVIAVMGVLAPPAAADEIDGDPLTITADGKGRIQIVDANQGGVKMFSEPSPGISNAGLEILQGSTYIALNGNRTNRSGPTLIGPGQLQSVYDVGADLLQVTETMTYVDGQNTVDIAYSVQNLTDAPLTFRAAEVADIGIGDDEFARGFLVQHASRSTLGGVTQDGELVALAELTEWDSFQTGFFGDVFQRFASGLALTDTADPRWLDSGVGAEFAAQNLDQHNGPNDTATFDVRWFVGPEERVNTPNDGDDGACTTAADGCSLREALISDSAAGDIVTVPESQYTLGGPLALTHDLTILGGGPRFTRIHGAASGPVISVPNAVTLDMRGVGVTDGAAGGIAGLAGSSLKLADVTVADNSGPGIAAAGTLDLQRSTISGNTATGDGGGILAPVSSGPVVVENSTISSNTAGGAGGGILTENGVTLTNTTIADNTADAGAGGLHEQVDTQKSAVTNTLFVRNTGGNCGGTPGSIDSKNSLYDGDDSCSFNTSSGDRTPADPRVGPLADHGGDTNTHAPQGGSDALDHGLFGSCPAIDQRGEPRSAACDIGAMEGTETPGTLVVFANVINDRDGHAQPSDFRAHVRVGATDVVTAQSLGGHAPTLHPPGGSYRLVVTGPTGYTLKYSGGCAADGSFTLAPAGSKTCTVTAEDIGGPRGGLQISTRVFNDNGGTLGEGSFKIRVRNGGVDVPGSPTRTGDFRAQLDPGTYSVTIQPPAGYTATINGACSTGTVTVVASTSKFCQVFGDDIPPPAHKKVNVAPKSGTVLVKLPGKKKFAKLVAGKQIPLGSIVDTRKGRVTLVAASDEKGNTVSADFFDGLFKVGQTKAKKPITVLTLVEKLSCKGAGKAAAALKKKKRKRRLWGDGHGKFRTKGSFSSATVRGTKWLVQDTCSTTTTKVKRGRVAVRDFVKDKTVLVKAGKTYVARHG